MPHPLREGHLGLRDLLAAASPELVGQLAQHHSGLELLRQLPRQRGARNLRPIRVGSSRLLLEWHSATRQVRNTRGGGRERDLTVAIHVVTRDDALACRKGGRIVVKGIGRR